MSDTVQANFRFPKWLMEKIRERKKNGHGSGRKQLQDAFVEQYMKGSGIITDKDRIDWLSDKDNRIGNIILPRDVVERNVGDMRAAIDEAMEYDQ